MLRRPDLLTIAGSRAFARSRRRPQAQRPIQRQAGFKRDPPAAQQSGTSDPEDNQINMVNKVMALVSCVTCGAAIWNFTQNKRVVTLCERAERVSLLPSASYSGFLPSQHMSTSGLF